jgi:hypothetical protein
MDLEPCLPNVNLLYGGKYSFELQLRAEFEEYEVVQ